MTNGFGHTARGVVISVLVLVLLATVCLRSSPPPMTAVPKREALPRPVVRSNEAPRDDSPIRVALTSRPVESFSLKIDGPFRVRSPSSGSSADIEFKALPRVRVDLSKGDRISDEITLVDGLEIVPLQSPVIWLNDRKYRGSVRFRMTGDGRAWPINVLPLEDYVAAVVDAEMPAYFGAAAREAQAIVARSYAVSCRQKPVREHFDLYSTPVSQNYLGIIYQGTDGRLLAGETPSSRDAAEATRGLVCTYQGRLFRTYYSACCGGLTSSAHEVFSEDVPALQAVSCGECDAAPLFRWKRFADDVSSFNRLTSAARTRSPAFRSVRSAWTSRKENSPARVAVSDGRRTVHLSSAEVKSALRLPSLLYDVSGDSERIVVRGRGHGHGVGLCQWGAKGLAEKGFTAEGIIRHYYPGCELVRLR